MNIRTRILSYLEVAPRNIHKLSSNDGSGSSSCNSSISEDEEEELLPKDSKNLKQTWIADEIEKLKRKFNEIAAEDTFLNLIRYRLQNEQISKEVFTSKVITMKDLTSFSLSNNNCSNVFGQVLVCRIIPTSIFQRNETSSSSSSSSSSTQYKRKKTLSLLAVDDTGQVPCILTNPHTKLLEGIYYFSKWKLVRAHKPQLEVNGCAEGAVIFHYLEIDTIDVKTYRISYLPPPNDISRCFLNIYNSTNKKFSNVITLKESKEVQEKILSNAMTVDEDALLKSSCKRQKHSIRGRLTSVSPLYQQPKDRTKSFCFFDIGSEHTLLTTHVYLRGLNAETWHPFLRVGDCCIVTNLCNKILEAVDGDGKSELKYSVLVSSGENDSKKDNRTKNGPSKKKRKITKNSLTTIIFRIDENISNSSSNAPANSSSNLSPHISSKLNSSLVSYEGIITRRVDDFTFELDNNIQTRLYLINYMCNDLGVGLRAGTKVILQNVHIIRGGNGSMVGFGACVHSQIQIINIAPGFDTIVVARSFSRVRHLAQHCDNFKLAAWLTKTMCTLSEILGKVTNSRVLFGSSSTTNKHKSSSCNLRS